MPLDESRIPVVIGTGQALERASTVSALELAERAAEQCLAPAPGIRARVELVSVVNIMSKASASPATFLARRLGLARARTEVTTVGGNSPQWLISRAADAIAAGELSAALVVGAEAQHSAKALALEGGVAETVEALDRDPVVGDDRIGVSAAELAVGLVTPVHVYALFESVIAAPRRPHLGAAARRVGHAHVPLHRRSPPPTPTPGSETVAPLSSWPR